MASTAYVLLAASLGLVFLGLGAALLGARNPGRARRVFLASVVYLPVLLAGLVLDKLVR